MQQLLEIGSKILFIKLLNPLRNKQINQCLNKNQNGRIEYRIKRINNLPKIKNSKNSPQSLNSKELMPVNSKALITVKINIFAIVFMFFR